MSAQARDAYLESQVRTATPQRLRLMLIDGAIRFARQALGRWDHEDQQEAVYDSLVRCRDIIMELYGSIQRDASPMATQVAAIYFFLFRLMAEAPVKRDPQKVREVIGVLEEERETWRQLCDAMPEPPEAMGLQRSAEREITAPDGPPESEMSCFDASANEVNGSATQPQGFSLDA